MTFLGEAGKVNRNYRNLRVHKFEQNGDIMEKNHDEQTDQSKEVNGKSTTANCAG